VYKKKVVVEKLRSLLVREKPAESLSRQKTISQTKIS
jgi:hypothetical protein